MGEVFKFEAGEEPQEESRRQDIFEIINYRAALQAAAAELRDRPFTLNLLLKLHEMLLDSVRGRFKGRGRLRREQNWIGRAGSTIEEADFVPPPPDLIQEYLDDWEEYYHSDEKDILVQLAIVHAQFEILHPFLDGNGRLGRILIPLFLHERGILDRPVFYLSGYLDRYRDQYISRLREIGQHEKSWNSWIEFFLEALIRQAEENSAKVREIMSLYERLKQQVLALTHSQYAVPLLDVLFQRPIIQSTHFDDFKGMPSKPMIMRLLSQLRDGGVLKVVREGGGRRAQILMLADLVNVAEGRSVF